MAALGIAAAAAIAAVLIALLSGGGGSAQRQRSVAGHSAGGGSTLVQVAAGYLHTAPSQLRRKLRSGETLAEVAAQTKGASRSGLLAAAYAAKAHAIRARHLPAAQERAELAAVRRQLSAQVDQARRSRRIPSAARRYLGLGEAQLRQDLAGGQTLGEIAAKTPGRSRTGLIDALLGRRSTALERELAERRVTARVERRAMRALRRRVLRVVDRRGA